MVSIAFGASFRRDRGASSCFIGFVVLYLHFLCLVEHISDHSEIEQTFTLKFN